MDTRSFVYLSAIDNLCDWGVFPGPSTPVLFRYFSSFLRAEDKLLCEIRLEFW